MSARWEVALDDLLDTYIGWNKYPHVAQTFADYEESKLPGWKKIFTKFHERVSAQLFNADPIYIDPEMMTLIESAAESFMPEALLETDLIIPAGFISLPRPLYMKILDDNDDPEHPSLNYSYRYISWGLEEHWFEEGGHNRVLMVCLWRNKHDKDDFGDGMDYIPYQMPILQHLMPWPIGVSYPTNTAGSWYQITKYLQATWRLMSQTISVKSENPVSRGVRKRAEKVQFQGKKVTVVTLRRPHKERDPDSEPVHVEWSHRWIVTGHWRNQYFPSLKNNRQMWISPFIKGPENKPLEVRKSRVFEFVR